jgi:hypothetical protein
VLTVGKWERYWGWAEGVIGLCHDLAPFTITFPGGHAKEWEYNDTIQSAMAMLLQGSGIDQDSDMVPTDMSSDMSSDMSEPWSMSD